MAKKPKKNVVEFNDNKLNFDGTKAVDIVTGNDLDNDINGAGGNDKIKGEGGNDTLIGGAGNDKIWGGAGNDTMFGGIGDDKLYADEGNDAIDGGAGDDTVIISGNFVDATVTLSNGVYTIVSGTQTITVENVELFKFADGTKTADQLITTPPQSYILKVEPDLLTGTNGDNTFVGTEATLSSADNLDGAEGTDTLQYSSSGAAAVVESGFKTTNIENFLVTSDAVGGTTFDVTGVTGAKNITNDNSSTNLTITGLTTIVDVGMSDVSAGNTTVTYQDAALKGAADVQNVILEGNGDLAGNDVSVLTIGSFGGTTGIESLNITTKGTATALDDIVTGAATVTITGDQDLEIDQILNGASVIDASKFTGKLDVAADSGVLSVVVTGGTGDDFADFSAGFGAGDKYDGGAGKDAIGLTNAVASAALGGAVSNVEVLAITDAATGTLDMDKFTGINEVHLDGGINTGNTELIKNAVTGLVVELDTSFVGANGSLTVDQKVDGAADTVTLNIDNIFKGDSYGVINLDDAETVTISAKDEDNTPGNIGLGGITIADLQVADATKIVLSGTADIKITDIDGNVDPTKNTVTSIDASKMTGDLDITGLGGANGVLSTAGATILLGSGNDKLNDGTGLGADTVTTGAGKDSIAYTKVDQSAGTKVDIITDFTQGSDSLSLQNLVSLIGGDASITTTKQFVGTFANFGSAQGALTALGGVQAVFQADTNTLWVDANDDGALNANDLQIVLKGVTALTAADLGLTAGNTINLTAPAAVLNGTTKTNADNFTTKAEDTINAAAAELVGSTINGLEGTDTLVIEDKANGATVGAGITNVEQLTLAVGTLAGGVTVNNSAIDKISVTTGDATVVVTDASNSLVFVGGAGSEDLTLEGGAYTATANLNGGGAGDILGLVNGTDIRLATVAGFETARLSNGANVGLTVAQHNAFTAIIGAGGSETIVLGGPGGTLTGNALVENYDASAVTSAVAFTLGAAAQNFTGSNFNDTVTISGLTTTGGLFGGAGNDKLVLSTGTNIAGSAFAAFEGADITGSVTMTEAEHDALAQGTLGIVAAGATDQITIAAGAITSIVTAAAIETYVIGDDTTDAFTVGINSATQVITATATTDDVTFFLDSITSFTGTITGEATTNDELFLDAGESVVGASINNVEDLFLNGAGTYSMDLADWDGFTGTVTAAGANTVALAGSGTTEADAVVENYVLNGAGVNVFSFDEVADATLTDAVRNGMSINLAAGTSTVIVTNAAIDPAANSGIDILSFLSGTDKLDINVGAANHNAGYQTITAAGTNITVAANSVIEIQSTVGTAIDLTAVGNAGGVETLIASAIADADTALNNGNDLTFIIYSGANAGIYNVDVTTASADMVAADITVELVAIVNGVGADALTSGDFI